MEMIDSRQSSWMRAAWPNLLASDWDTGGETASAQTCHTHVASFGSVHGHLLRIQNYQNFYVGRAFAFCHVVTGSVGVVLIDQDFPLATATFTSVNKSPEPFQAGLFTWAKVAHSRWSALTSAVVREALESSSEASKDAPFAVSEVGSARADSISKIQGVFGIASRQMAQLLKISRPMFYKWVDRSLSLTLREKNKRRLASLDRLANEWRRQSQTPLASLAHISVSGSKDVLDLLRADPIDEDAIRDAFKILYAAVTKSEPSLSQRMREAGFSRSKTRAVFSEDD